MAETRKNETFITLTRDTDADKKENKKSFPKKISGPKTLSIDKDAVYTLDTYGASATENDKKNIRWSFYIQGHPKATTADKEKTYIDAKSKAGWYTYAKSEIINSKNQLTLVFDKALIGKKVQIEAFRESPDIDNAKDYVRTTTIQKAATPKIAKRETTSLWLQTQCESVENAGEMINEEFKSYFKLETPNTIHIYHDGYISKLNFDALTKVKYRYHDKNGNKHKISECELYETWKMGSGNKNKQPTASEKSSATIIDYAAKGVSGVDAKKTYLLTNNDVYTEGIVSPDYSYNHLYYTATTEKVVMVIMPNIGLNYKNGDTLIKFKWHKTLRRFSQPEVFAAFIGALAECGYSDVNSGGSSYKDGSSYPSLSHNNGYAIDTGYLDNTREQKLINALNNYGFLVQYKGTSKTTLTGATSASGHNSHLHSGGAPKNGVIKFKPKYK